MSVKLMGLIWDSALPRNQRLVALSLADHASHDGENIYPSVERTAWKTGYSERAVQVIIKELVEDGILINVGKNKRYQTNKYKMDASRLPTRPDLYEDEPQLTGGAETAPPQKTAKGVQKKTEGVQKTAEKVSKTAPKPLTTVKEPLLTITTTTDSDDFRHAVKVYEQEIGLITRRISEKIGDALEDFGIDLIVEAINIAADNNVRKWNYVNGVLVKWQREGRGKNPKRATETRSILDSDGNKVGEVEVKI